MSACKIYSIGRRAPFLVGLLAFAGSLGLPDIARAVQVHGSPEGLYVHQMGHVFFAAALVFLLRRLHSRPIGQDRAWRYFKIALIFFLLWNIDTFVVHWISSRLPDDAIFDQGPLSRHYLSLPLDGLRLIYYLGRFDHLLCLPGMWFLVRSLQGFCAKAEMQCRQKNGQSTT